MSSEADADPSPDDTDQQMVRALIGIGAELTRIRRLLEAQQDATSASASVSPSDGITCRSCGDSFATEREGWAHARREHGAPQGSEGDLFE